MGVFDWLRDMFGKKKEMEKETPEQWECRECREAVLADINRFGKYIKEYSEEIALYQKRGVTDDNLSYQSAVGELQRFTYSLYEVERMLPFIRENQAADIDYRDQIVRTFARQVKNLLPEDSVLRFHGTPVYFAEEILKSGKISSSADRFDGYIKSTDMAGEISVADVNGLGRTVNYFVDAYAYLRCMPCGCLFVLDGEGQTSEQNARSVMDLVDFNKDPERLVAVISSPENMEKIKDWLEDAGLSPELACTFENFVVELEAAREENHIDSKLLRSPEVVRGSREAQDGLGLETAAKPIVKEETHWWRDCAQRELPDADYYVKNFTEEQLKELVVANRTGHDISVFADSGQTPEQMRFICLSAEAGEDVTPYIHNLDFDPEELNEARSAIFLKEIMESHEAKLVQRERELVGVDELIASAKQTKATLNKREGVREDGKVRFQDEYSPLRSEREYAP